MKEERRSGYVDVSEKVGYLTGKLEQFMSSAEENIVRTVKFHKELMDAFNAHVEDDKKKHKETDEKLQEIDDLKRIGKWSIITAVFVATIITRGLEGILGIMASWAGIN